VAASFSRRARSDCSFSNPARALISALRAMLTALAAASASAFAAMS